jgi:hypothetical protein
MEEIFQWVVVEIWGRVIVATLVAGLTALGFWPLKSKSIPWRHKVLFGLAAFVLTLWGFNQINYALLESKSLGVLRPSGDVLTQWITDSGIGVTKIGGPDTFFKLELRTPSNTTFYLYQEKASPNLLIIAAKIGGTKEQQDRLKGMSEEEREKIVAAIRHNINTWAFAGNAGRVNHDFPISIYLQYVMIYDEPITKRELLSELKKFASAIVMTQSTISTLIPMVAAK